MLQDFRDHFILIGCVKLVLKCGFGSIVKLALVALPV